MYVRVTALRAAENALPSRMRPAGRSLPTSGLARQMQQRCCNLFPYCCVTIMI